jgi:hypothetical protein
MMTQRRLSQSHHILAPVCVGIRSVGFDTHADPCSSHDMPHDLPRDETLFAALRQMAHRAFLLHPTLSPGTLRLEISFCSRTIFPSSTPPSKQPSASGALFHRRQLTATSAASSNRLHQSLRLLTKRSVSWKPSYSLGKENGPAPISRIVPEVLARIMWLAVDEDEQLACAVAFSIFFRRGLGRGRHISVCLCHCLAGSGLPVFFGGWS